MGYPKNGLQQMPPLYNTYGAWILRSKFYKDKQNWTPETDLVGARLLWNFVLTAILLNPKTMIKTVISRSLLVISFNPKNLESHLAILLNQG